MRKLAPGPHAARLTAPSPRVLDIGLAVGLSVVDVATLVVYRRQLHPLGVALALVVAQNIPLIWRRSNPRETFVAIGGARVAYDLLRFRSAPLPLGPAIAVFTVVDLCTTGVRTTVGAVLIAGIVVSQLPPGHNEPSDATVAVLIFLTAWIAGTLNRTRRAYTEEVEHRATQAEAERDHHALQAAAEERARIARELHDVVAHHVSLIAVQAEAAASLLPQRPTDAARSVEVIGATARQALSELRHLLGVLRSPSPPFLTAPAPSLDQLDGLLDQVRQSGLRVDFDQVGVAGRLPPAVELTAYRIIQEALTNAMRHAQTSSVAVTLCYEPSFVTVSIADSGPGPGRGSNGSTPSVAPEAPAVAHPGFGLEGIAERVASLGGNLTVGPTLSGGFAVSARLPAR